jgi:ABC-2 type transport system permease protein
MKALTIAGVNVRRMIRDRSNFFFVFVLPLLLILVLGAVYGGGSQPRLGVTGGGGGPLADALVSDLADQPTVKVIRYSDSDAMALAVERGELEAGLELPADYDQQARSRVEVGFIARSLQEETELRTVVAEAVARQNAVLRAAGFAVEQGVAGYSQALAAAQAQQVNVGGITVASSMVGEPYGFTLGGRFDLGAQSELILFIFLTSLAGSAALIQTRTFGVSRRMLATPTPVRTVLVGEALGRFGVALVQGLFIVAGTWIIFGVDWGDPVATAAVLVVFSLVGAGAAMLMGSVFSSDAQASGIGVLLGLGLAALGGCMVPLQVFQLFSPSLYQVAHVTPHAWALEAFIEIAQRGGGLGNILPELGILLGYAVVFLAAAAVALRHTLTRA